MSSCMMGIQLSGPSASIMFHVDPPGHLKMTRNRDTGTDPVTSPRWFLSNEIRLDGPCVKIICGEEAHNRPSIRSHCTGELVGPRDLGTDPKKLRDRQFLTKQSRAPRYALETASTPNRARRISAISMMITFTVQFAPASTNLVRFLQGSIHTATTASANRRRDTCYAVVAIQEKLSCESPEGRYSSPIRPS